MKLKSREKNSGRNATKRNLHKIYARHNLKRYLYLTQKSGFVNTKSRKIVHKYLFGFYALCLKKLVYADKSCDNNKHLSSLFQLIK